MPSQIKEHFTSVFSKACECAGEGLEWVHQKWDYGVGNYQVLGELGVHWFEDRGFNNIIHHFWKNWHKKL